MFDIVLIWIFLIMFVCLGLSLLTYSFFWYETADGSYRDYLDELSKGKTLWWLTRGVLTGFGSALLVVLFFPLQFYSRLWRPKVDPECPLPPVILVHGLYHNSSAWTVFRFWLRRSGFTNVHAMSYSSWKYTFQELLLQLDALVKEVADGLPGQKVILIGHSLGGLLSRAYVDKPENAKRVAAVVTLGAPHHGSKLSALGVGRLARSLAYRGRLIEEIERAALPCDVPRLAISTPVDNMVLPGEALRITSAGWSFVETSPVSHVSLLYHYRTAKAAVGFILRKCRERQTSSGSTAPSEAAG